MRIQAEDRVKAVSGHFEGKSGYVTRVFGDSACVVWKDVWEHGLWVDVSEIKRTKRYKSAQGIKGWDKIEAGAEA